MNIVNIVQNGQALLKAYWYFRQATSLGRKVRVWGKPFIRNRGAMIIGERVRLDSTVATTELVAVHGGDLVIGNGTFINYGCSIAANQSVRIGANCNIGTYVIIMDDDVHRLESERRNEKSESATIILEDNVWLGAWVIVLGGVTIGEGSVIGAGSVVTHDIPPRSLVVGMPARMIRTL